ncbi:lasso peptide biosynthesis B2 protein [Novosphingobium panipatense]|jgi:hypothetical protein|uniref:Transglutaminase-like superfamily protein n=1 Tax=Novosphingobium panipatense TaxID=428991 RepID=A0ABY1QUT1_9SPHN|nr:lasso peptide biosynthesis B2 protein [Novosphingobium panipatense]SMP79599.1 Transglutaminase-like superfamily protein [Novosphingobium panipatense]
MRDVVLKPRVGFCATGQHLVFLDAERDRYCMLAPRLEAYVRDWATGNVLEQAILADLVATGLFEPVANGRTASEQCSIPRCTDTLCGSHPTADRNPKYWIRFIWACLLLAFFNALTGTLPLKGLLAISGSPRTKKRNSSTPKDLSPLVESFVEAALFFPRKDRCLPDALALRTFLAWHSCPTRIVFGVQSEPFQAHCWVQFDNILVGQDLETVMPFSPILALP